jgi:acetoin utilization protein AcuB
MFIDKSMTREVVTIDPEASILEAQQKMKDNGIRHLPVVREDNTLVGIVTDRDVRGALPSALLTDEEIAKIRERLAALKVSSIMTTDLVTVSPANTLEDALLLMERVRVGAFPVVNQDRKLIGILSIRDLMRAFINVLGLHEPGALLCILAENKLGTMKRIVDAISEERIPFGSILVARHWEEGKRAVFPYLLTSNLAQVKRKLESLGFRLLDPMQWYLDRLPEVREQDSRKPSP